MFKIVNIKWIRPTIHITIDKKENINSAYLLNNNLNVPCKIINNEIVINITNVLEGQMLDSGKWQLYVDGDSITVDESMLPKLDDYSRVFKYRRGFYAVIIEFILNDKLEVFIQVDYMMQNRKPKKFLRVCEGSSLLKKSLVLIKILFTLSINLLYKFFRMFKRNEILLLSENSNELSSNLLKVKESFENKNYYVKTFSCNMFDGKLKIKDLLKEIYLIANSKTIIVDNYSKMINLLNIKSKIIQIWHAGVGFKAVGYARFGKNDSPHPYCSSHRKYDLVIVDDEKLIPIYEEVFGVSKEKIIPAGLPRLDNYLDKENIQSRVNYLSSINSEILNKKVILFAPTYRGDGQEDAYYDYSQIDLKRIYDFIKKENFLFIIKMHPFIKNKKSVPEKYSDLIYDYSNIDINDLIYISDIMITDYSSCAYEFSMFDRPLLFYRYDKQLYEYLRPMHSLDMFCNKQKEVTTFEDLMKYLEENKNIDIKNRFKGIKNTRKSNSCDIIIKEAI